MIKTKLIKYGFTFIEMVMAVAIMAILAVIVIPSISERLNRTKVDTAAQTMLKNAQFLHKWANITGGYSNTKQGQGTCPYLPFEYESDSSNRHYYYLASSDSNLLGKIGNNDRVKLKPSSCFANSFTLRAYPICGSSVEKSGVICLDHDGNILKNADQDCNPRSDTSQIICAYDDTKDDKRDNDPSESNSPAPPIPSPSIDPDPFCNESTHSGDLACICKSFPDSKAECETIPFCLEHPSQKQCRCVLHPQEKDCKDYCSTDAGHNDKSCPGWCSFDPSRESDPYCDKSDGGDIPSSCIDKPEREICYDQCKFQSPKADWCKDACGKIPNPPGWCESQNTPSGGFESGDVTTDTCGNTLVCLNSDCNKYLPDNVESRSNAWQLKSCNNPAAGNFLESGSSKLYKQNDIVNNSSCTPYRCVNKNGCSSNQPSKIAPLDKNTVDWIPCYATCPASMASYSINSYSFNTSCSKLYVCDAESKYCNDITGGHQPGSDIDIDGVTAWRSDNML